MDFPGYLDRLTPEERSLLEPLLRRESYRRGEALFRQGDLLDRLYFLESGTLKMVLASAQGRDVILEILFAGEICGAMCSHEPEPSGLTALCVDEVEVASLSKDQFLELADRCPNLVLRAFDACRQKLRQQQERAVDLAVETPEHRAARTLLVLGSRLGVRTERGLAVRMVLDHAEFSDLIGTSVETVEGILGGLRLEGVVDEQEGQIVVLDEVALRQKAGLA